ncbi:Na+/H+ antiporter NhaC [Pseudogracilibacillus sp. SO10305]|uniref:Na+/H+ antiporter NhaC n=1 Tax=Pseudogracilibacillus sp. SO10305 TaxID=3098292 RepID=UPI00300DFAF7
MENKVRLPSKLEVIILLALFLLIMASSALWMDIPFQLSLFIVWFLFIIGGLYLGHTYNDLQGAIASGIYKGMEATLIVVAVGALIGTWISGGIVPTLIYYGLAIIHPTVFLTAAVILCSLTSLFTGTSYGTVGTTGVAMLAVGASFGIPLPLVAGAVLSGAYFGDKISPLSDTTILAASLSKVELMDHVKSMLYVSLPSLVISCTLFFITGIFYVDNTVDLSVVEANMASLQQYFNIGWYMLIPIFFTLALLALRKPALPTIVFGAFLGAIWTWLFQGNNFLSSLKIAYSGPGMESGDEFIDLLLNRGGIVSMLEVVLFCILALGFGGLMDKMGIITVISEMFSQWVRNSTGNLTVSTIVTAFFGNLFGSAGYVSIITGSKMTEKNYDRLHVDRRVLSRNTEAGGTLTAAMVPWNDNAIYMAGVLGLSTMAYLPFMWYAFISIGISILYGYTGKFIWRTKEYREINIIEDIEEAK